MTTTKNRWQDVIGTMRDYLRVGFAGPRLKNNAGVLEVRNAGDSADANMKASLIQLSGGSPGSGKILTSDASGNGTWQTNPAIAAAANAQSLAEQVVNQIYQFGFFGDEMHYSSGTPVRLVSSAFPYNWITSTTTIGATALAYFMGSPGTWEIHILTVKNVAYAKVDATIDGTGVLAGYDLYSPTTDYAHEIVLTGIPLTNHQHLMTFTAVGKNASATGYAMAINKVWGRRTGV